MDNRKKFTRRTIAAAVLAATLVSGIAFATDYYTGKIVVKKFYDKNANGVLNTGEPLLSGWPMTLTPPGTTKNTVSGVALFPGLAAGYYSVLEGTPNETNWHQSAPRVGGLVVNPVTVHLYPGQTKVVKFGNFCKKPSGGRTPGFWSNKNGEATMNDGATGAAFELGLLSALNLVDANGNAFDPTTYASFRTWLLDGNAVNMAYMLSVHLAAMRLNVEAGFVSGSAFYIPYGGTINSLIAAADAALAADPLTLSGDPNRAAQERLKNFLDALNNGALVVPSHPCKRTFGYVPY